jgi:hypothetical protein
MNNTQQVHAPDAFDADDAYVKQREEPAPYDQEHRLLP